MSACVYCRQRKGKRPCPALNGTICPVCCGTHRGLAIACPRDCVYFLPGETYQRGRSGQQFFRLRQPLYDALHRAHGGRALALLNVIDFACYGYAAGRANATDQEVLAGMEQLRGKLSPLTLASAGTTACAQHLWSIVEAWLKQQPQDRELLRDVLDQAIAFARTLTGPELAGRRFVTGLLGMIEERFPEQAGELKGQPDTASPLILRAASR
ncbi:MAG: hypothetical protein AB1515_06535 [Nitrospirota bacterium]